MYKIMHPQFLYFEDPLTLEFTASVLQKLDLPGGRTGVILDRTYFYPTGGGQEHDTGTLGDANVVEVIKGEDEVTVVHVLDREIPPGPVVARIDRDRRLRHMQHHTAQHLLTQCFLRLFDLETASANINGYSPSTLDIPLVDLSKKDVDRVEDLANQIIYENRAVKSYFVTPEGLSRLPLRRMPKVTENIRVVEIDSYDFTPCGGTHCLTTGMIGLVKILKTERQSDQTRIVFIAGLQALRYFREYHEIVAGLAGQLSVHPLEISVSVQRQAEQLHSAQKELHELRVERIAFEARKLAEAGEMIDSRRVVLVAFEQRPPIELRALAEEFKRMSNTVAVLATLDGQKFSLVTACSEGTGISARELLNHLLVPLGGRGGGDLAIAQGGGAVTESLLSTFFEVARNYLREI